MLLRVYLMMYRKRLITIAVIAVLFPLFVLLITSSERLLTATDACLLLLEPFFFTSFVFPLIMGISMGTGTVPTMGIQRETRMLLTRPMPRSALIVQPLLVAGFALAVLPALGWLLLLGWLQLVHAPVLSHWLALVEMAPSAASLGAHPNFLNVLAATHMVQRYVAATSVSLFIYSIFASQRWLLLHPDKRLRPLALITFLFIYLPAMRFLPSGWLRAIMLWAPQSAGLTYLPSIAGIALHLVIAAGGLFGCWRILQRLEL